MKTIGVTGSRDGMSLAQIDAFTSIIHAVLEPTEFHHGDCVGVDDEAANIVKASGNLFKIFAHPPILNDYRANNPHYDVIFSAKPYFERNRKIVDLCKRIIVIPKHMAWRATGGTWYTHDYAMKHKRWITVIWPNGTVTEIDCCCR